MLLELGRVTEPAKFLAKFRTSLARAVEEKGGDMKALSKGAGLGESFVRDALERREPKLARVATLAERYELSLDEMLGLKRAPKDGAKIMVLGEVGAGIWREVGHPERFEGIKEESPFPPDPNYAADAQFDLIVCGNSINRFARDGERLRCVDIGKAGIDVDNDDLVIVERRKDSGQLIETTAKRIRRRGAMVELWPDSDDPAWQEPLRIDTRKTTEHEEATIIALVLYAYNPARKSRGR